MAKFKAVVKDSEGEIYALSDNTYIGAVQPTDPDKTIWFNPVANNIKVYTNGNWSVVGPGGCITVNSPTNLPSGYSVIIVTGTDVADQGNALLSFASTPPAGSVTDIIILPQPDSVGSHGWTLTVPTADWNGEWIGADIMPIGDTLLVGVTSVNTKLVQGNLPTSSRNIFIGGSRDFDPSQTGLATPVYIRAISDGERVYFVYQTAAS